ncbi:MAG: hypothetical protein KF802_03260 [Bdellovibrionaceae bacterium]|nr:hypothetical protein [Pseudobdellovibrionaceae bacterium]MBX3033361.1 hypothetical protein [Pseudobdellovibrionaceae bacterium]
MTNPKIHGDTHEFVIEGPLDEKAPLFRHDLTGAQTLILDMKGLSFINSVGVTNWIQWAAKLPPGLKVKMRQCPMLLLNQLRNVHGFMPKGGVVESLQAPYVCPSCNAERTLLFEDGVHYGSGSAENPGKPFTRLPEPVDCPDCGDPMEEDFIEHRLFGFLTLRRSS